jgi:hypothetical protein
MTVLEHLYKKNPERKSFASAPAIIALIFLECLVASQALLAYQDHFLTVSQMREQGINQGLPFLWHFGMWSDLFIISTLAAYLIGRYSSCWRLHRILASLAIGLISAGLMSWLYTFSGMPEAHVQNHHLTAAGVVHLVYMAIAIAVFIQFLFFTEGISDRLLRFVSVLLFIHVFVGTHMALGIITLIYPLDWYPAHPLTSIFGWGTVAAVGVSLALRNFELSRYLLLLKKTAWYARDAAIWLFEQLLYWTNQSTKTAEEYLKFLNFLSSFLAAGFFIHVIWSRISSPYRSGKWLPFVFSNEGPALVLIFLFAIIYFSSRHSAKNELKIVPTLFPRGDIPDEWQPKERAFVTLTVFGFLALYIALVLFVDYITIVAFCMLAISCIDYRTRYLINGRMGQYLSAERYAPRIGENDYDIIQRRRTAVKCFLFDKPHLRKEAGRITGCGVALGIAVFSCAYSVEWLRILAYVVLIGTLITNEIVTHRWRFALKHQLEKAEM